MVWFCIILPIKKLQFLHLLETSNRDIVQRGNFWNCLMKIIFIQSHCFEFNDSTDCVLYENGFVIMYYMFFPWALLHTHKIVHTFEKPVWNKIRSSQFYKIIINGKRMCTHHQWKIYFIKYFYEYIAENIIFRKCNKQTKYNVSRFIYFATSENIHFWCV